MKGIVIFLTLLLCIVLVSCGSAKAGNGEKKPLYYANPMDPSVKSDVPMQDSMGMDYIPIYPDTPVPTAPHGLGLADSPTTGSGQVIYWASPMDSTIHSDHPIKDEAGEDYLPVYETAAPEKGISLTAEQEKRIGVAITPVRRQIISSSFSTVGKITLNEQHSAVVSARYPGRIDKLLTNYTGAPVQAGQTLLVMYAPTLVTTQQELIAAVRDQKTGSTLSAIDNELVESIKSKLALWGLYAKQIQDIIDNGKPLFSMPVLSPISGTVLKMNVLAGQYVEEGFVLYELADLSSVWVEAEVYEQDLFRVNLNSNASITALSYPNLQLEGKISFISPQIDTATRTARIRIELDNRNQMLKPGMLVNVDIRTPGTESQLVLPESAVLDTGIRKLVYIKTKNGQYVARVVTLGPKAGTFYPVVSGVLEGELVVTQANFLIDSESRLKGLVN